VEIKDKPADDVVYCVRVVVTLVFKLLCSLLCACGYYLRF
jgi:hypothetical protein